MVPPLTRRTFLAAAATAPLWAAPPKSNMGIATTSFMTYAKYREPLDFLDRCHALGAAGVQVALPSDATQIRKVRGHAEDLGMYLEGMVPMPKSTDTAAFEAGLRNAKEAGAIAVRTQSSGGRRYEKWTSLADWKAFFAESSAALQKMAAIAERVKIPVGLENHKDWTIEEQVPLMKQVGGEYFGTLLDFGNNIALLDSPEAVMELAPWAKTCHLKDMAVQPYDKGFLLSEVPLGEGFLNLKGMVDRLRAANPRIRFALEMITRDPLEVPCLTDLYWVTFPERNGRYLARTMAMVEREARRAQPLPFYSQLSAESQLRVEEENVKTCLNFAREKLGL